MSFVVDKQPSNKHQLRLNVKYCAIQSDPFLKSRKLTN